MRRCKMWRCQMWRRKLWRCKIAAPFLEEPYAQALSGARWRSHKILFCLGSSPQQMLLERHRYVAQTLWIRCNTQKARDAQAVGLEICQCKQFPSSQCIQKLVLHVQVSQLCLFFVPRKVVAKSSHFKDVSLHQNARPCLSSSATSWQSPPQVGSPQATTSPCIAIRRKNPNEP
jgi:hypothetical protein